MSRKHDSARRARVLAFENLENRELLTVSPLLTTAAAIEPNAIRDAWIAGSNYSELPGPIDFTLPEEEAALELSNVILQNYDLTGYTLTFTDVNCSDVLFDNLFGVESVVFTGAEQCTITCDGKDYAGWYSYTGNNLNFGSYDLLPLSLPGFSGGDVYEVEVQDLGDPSSFYPGGQVEGYVRCENGDLAHITVNVSGTRTLAQPQIKSVAASASTIDVAWDRVEYAEGYQVSIRKSGSTTESYYTRASGENWIRLYDLAPNTTYEVKVVALGNGGSTLNSAASSYTTVKTRAFITLAQPTVTVVSTDKRSIDITWNEVPNGKYYAVICYDPKTDIPVGAATIDPSVSGAQYSFTNLTPGTSYRVKVVAIGDGLYTKTSKETAYKTVKTDSLVTLAQPTITSVTSDARRILVTWKPVEGVRRYDVICSSSATNEYIIRQVIPPILPGDALYNFENLTPGTTYTVRVVAKGDGINTSDSKDTAYKTIKTISLPTLATPTITQSSSDKSSISVVWKSVPDATGYQVSYRSSNSTESYSVNVSADETSYAFSNLTPGTSYTVGVVAYGDRKNTMDSKEATKKISTKSLATLAQPTITTVTSDFREISVEWKLVDGAQGYVAICSSSTANEDVRVDLPSDETSYRFVNLTPGVSYKVKVVAKGDGIDTSDSKDTAYKTIKTKSLPTLATPTITSLTSDKRTINVAWKSVPDATGYYVSYRSLNSPEGDSFHILADETSYTFVKLTPGTSYTIGVVALGDWYTADSKEATKKISTKSLVTLAQPTITSLTSDKRSIDVAWKAVNNASGYQVSYSAGNSSDRTYEYVDAETTRFSVSKLTPGTSYTVRVVALGDGLDTQNSKDTSYKKITTKSLETLATPTITSSTSDKRSIAFSWNAVTGATLYEVSYTTASGGFVTRAVQADQTSYTFSDLAPGTAYTVKVVAQGDYFNTANSKEATKKISTKSLVTLAQPTITSLTSDKRSINVAWKAVKNASGYQVSYSTANSSVRIFDYVDAETTSFTFDKLTSGTSYAVRVVALGDGLVTQNSKETASKTIKTKPLTTLAKPTITSCQTSDSAILVNWKRVDGANLILVEYKKAGTNDWQSTLVGGDETYCALEDLDAGAKYSVRAKALGDEYSTLDSQYSTTTTATLAKSPKLLAPAIIGVDPTAVTAKIEFEGRESAASYEVAYRKSGSKSWTKLVVPGNEFKTTLEDLKPNQSYGVKMRAIGHDGLADSDYCQETTFKTAVQTKLATPANFKVIDVTEDSITLSWDPVENAQDYQVDCVYPSGTIRNLFSGGTKRVVADLDPGTNYKIRIRAQGDDDYVVSSEFSSFLEVKTDDDDYPFQGAPDD